MSRVTPEARVKNKLRSLLTDSDRWGYIYHYWPVPGGYGATTLDVIGCYRGLFFAVEVKKPGGRPTLRQQGVIEDIGLAGGRAFVVDGEASLAVFEKWLSGVRELQEACP